MESAIRLCYSPIPSTPLRLFHGANGSSNARATRFHLKFNNANLFLSHFSRHHPITRSFGHAKCMLNRFSLPSENEGSDNKTLRGVTTVSLALACVVGLFNVSSKLNPKLNTAYAAWLPFSTTTSSTKHEGNVPKLPGPEDAYESLWQMINADHSKQTCPKIDREPDLQTIRDLKAYAVHLSKSGKKGEAKALKLLEDTYEQYKDGSTGLNLGMAWVELLMFQGNFKEACDRLHRLLIYHYHFDDVNQLLEKYNNSVMGYEQFSTSQILLYKAIILTKLKIKEAAKWWEAFLTTQNGN